MLALCLLPLAARAQWLTQTVRLKPGWNAVYLHVDASHATLDDLIPNAADPVAEVWLWRPTAVTMQFLDRPDEPNVSGTQWSVWTASRGDGDTLTRLVGNASYLVRNSSPSDYTWNIVGRPLPPAYQWTTTGLNLLGFPTPAGAAPTFDKFLAPEPGLDLAKSTANGVEVIRYTGGDLTTNGVNPRSVSPLEARTVAVNRGEAFWIRASTNYFNRYFGPVEISYQSPRGIDFSDTLGTYTIRLRNVTSSNRTVSLNIVASEAPPSGQTAIAGTPQLLVRGQRSTTDFSYAHTVLSGNSFTLAPDGQVGSEVEVVLGLNRSAMTSAAGSFYAGILRITDTLGLMQVDAPVSAKVPDMGGLWVGDASVGQVGQYLKTYPKINSATSAPRASYLDLDGSTGFGTVPPGGAFNGASATVEAWVNLRQAVDAAPLLGLQVRPADNATGSVSLVSFNLTASAGRLNPNIGVPLLLDQANLPDDGRSISANTPLLRNFNGTNSIGGQVISFDLTINGTGDNWGGVVLGASEPNKSIFVASGETHFGVLFRVNGMMQAFDGSSSQAPSVVTWTANNPARVEHHIDMVCSDPSDGNPFDGVGSTQVDVFVDGGASPVYTFTRGNGGYSDNFINFQPFNLSLMRVRNLTVGVSKPLLSSVKLVTGRWTHVAYVLQSGIGRIFMDGSLVGEGRVSAPASSVITRALIGANPETSAIAAAGVDDFRLWSVARSADEIRRDMATGRYAAATPGLALQYDFPASGAAGVDSSGSGRDLALNGSAVLGTPTLTPAEIQDASLMVSVASANRPLPGTELPGSAWVNRTPDFNRSYSALASSLDGSRLLAAVSGTGGRLYVSADAGATWTAAGPSTVTTWTSVASSGSGSTLAATANNDKIYVSTDGGATWTGRDSNRSWSSIAMSSDGQKQVATVLGGKVYTSTNAGATWTEREALRNWVAVASSADGSRLVAAVSGGSLYVSADSGVTWVAREANRSWSAVASSANGSRLVAAVNTSLTGGQIYVSTDGGATWSARENNRAWTSVASSADGLRLVAAAGIGGVFTSTDGGLAWNLQEPGRNWSEVASSSDGSRLSAAVDGGGVHTRSRQFASYTIDGETGLIRAQDGSYVSTGVNTNLARTATEFPMRLILHSDPSANSVKLLQRVFVGKGAASTNLVIASRESLLDAAQIASARRLSAAHLPFTADNAFWVGAGQLQAGTALGFTVNLSYKDQANNPFLHTFHPDHDNLQADFKHVEAMGVESYEITRQIRLTFAPVGTDFRSLTASRQTLGGTYEETMTLGGKAGASRQFRLAGTFSLQRVSPIASLTTQ